MIICPYTEADTQPILSLFHGTVHAVNSRDYSPEQVDAWAPQEMDADAWALRLSRNLTLVAEDGPLVVAFGDVENDGHLDHFYCHKDYQGRGVGTHLLAALASAARQRGLLRLFTEASITAKPFFENRGFRLLQEQTVFSRGVAFINYRMDKQFGKI